MLCNDLVGRSNFPLRIKLKVSFDSRESMLTQMGKEEEAERRLRQNIWEVKLQPPFVF